MSNPNLNFSNLDSRYSKPADVSAAIATQATADAGQYALGKDTLALRRLTDLAATDRDRSAGIARVAFEDNLSYYETWTDLTQWSSQSVVQVSNGRLYAITGGSAANSGINHGVSLGSAETLRVVTTALFNSGSGSAGGVAVGINYTDAAGATPVATGGIQKLCTLIR